MASKAMATHNGPPPKPTAVPPNQTLYITNLPEKIQKADLRMSLYTLFSTYGPVLDVVALKTPKMRGQAHVVFRDIQASTQAMRALQGFELFGKAIKIQFGKGRSNVFTRLEGVYKPPTEPVSTTALTEVQKSVFSAPIGGTSTANGAATEPVGLPPKPGSSTPAPEAGRAAGEEAKGVKRRREDDEEEEEKEEEEEDEAKEGEDEEAMDEEDDDDVSMEASSEEDN